MENDYILKEIPNIKKSILIDHNTVIYLLTNNVKEINAYFITN